MASQTIQQPNQQQPQWPSTINTANLAPTKLWFNYTSTNYPAWKEQMLCLVQSQGLLGYIDGTNPPPPENVADQADGTAVAVKSQDYDMWKRTDMLLKGWILCSLNDDVVYTVSSLNTSRDVWLELENRFRRLFNLAPPTTSTGGADPPAMAISEQNTMEKDLKDYLPLHRAAVMGDWEAAKMIFENDPNSMVASINIIKATALHTAVGTGKSIYFVEKLVAAMPEESIAVMDDIGGTALSVAAAVGNIAAAIILVKRMPNSVYIPNNFGNFPVQIAGLYAQRDMLKYLMSVTKDDCGGQNPYAGLPGLRLLVYVIDAEFFDIALQLVERYPDLARLKLPDNTTALKKISAKKSIFCYERRLSFWQRFIASRVSVGTTVLRPQSRNGCDIKSMARGSLIVFQSLNVMLWKFINGLGVMKSIKDKTLLKRQALKLVKCLCKEIESMSFVEAKDIYFDAILLAAQFGIHEVVEEIVEDFPSAIYCLTQGSKQYIFHVAVENRSEHVYNLIYQMSDHKHLYSDLQDSNGNNLLHLAGKLAPAHKLNEISGAALQMQHELLWYKEIENFVHPHSRERLNYAGKSPQMVFTEEHKILKEAGEKWMKDTANSCTIAAALIATVMFAAAITVPGGNNSEKGFPLFHRDAAFIVFAVSDAISLFTSATSLLMFLAILTSRYAEEDFLRVLPKRLIIGLATLFLSITFMMASFGATLYLVFGRKQAWVLIPVGALVCLPVTSFVLLQFPLLVDLISSTYGSGIFGKQSSRPFY